MKERQLIVFLLMLAFGIILMLTDNDNLLPLFLPFVFAHCDTEDGPVISAAKKALKTENVDHVLKWIPKEHEAELTDVFEKVLNIRKTSPQVAEMADKYFFETLVRIHRNGEGEPYTGIKPAGTEIDSIVDFADQSIETGSVDDLVDELSIDLEHGIRVRFHHVIDKARHKEDSVEAGREFVEAYISFVHFVEVIHNIISAKDLHHSATCINNATSEDEYKM